MNYEKIFQVACWMIVLTVLGGFAYFVETQSFEAHQPEITSFIESRGEKVNSLERHYYSTGPFWPDHRNTRIYCAKSDKNVYWFRYRWIGHDCIYLDQNGKYTELK